MSDRIHIQRDSEKEGKNRSIFSLQTLEVNEKLLGENHMHLNVLITQRRQQMSLYLFKSQTLEMTAKGFEPRFMTTQFFCGLKIKTFREHTFF